MNTSILTRGMAVSAVAAASLVALPATSASAAPADHVVINEVYVNGGSAGQTYKTKFVELYNPTDRAVDISTWSLQYRSGGSGSAFAATTKYDLTGVIQPGRHFLVAGGSNGANGADLPTPDQTTTLAPAAGGGTIALVGSTDLLPAITGNVKGSPSASNDIVDLIGFGTTNTFETAAAPGPGTTTNARSINRTGFADTDDNSADFTLSAVGGATPTACGASCVLPVPAPLTGTIAQIQGEGPQSPQQRGAATTRGVVTAVYRTGGFNGAFIQTAGTGGSIDLGAQDASDGIFVFGSSFAAAVAKGDFVEVTGTVAEFQGMTQLTGPTWTVLTDEHAPVAPAKVVFPLSEEQKESLEGMLLAPQGDYTVTNNFTTNQYAEIGLAPGTKPFDNPTNKVAPGADAVALAKKNAADLITLDDGASLNFLSAANQGIALPWLRADNEVRVGARVSFTDSVVLDYRNNSWKLQPQQQLTADGTEPVTFSSTRKAAPEDVGGQVKLATFNVLNYFTTTGVDYVDGAPGRACTYFNDRDGNRVTTNACGSPSASSGNGPRGAADQANLARQQAKIVNAINTLDADVVSLEEIENSAKLGLPRDTALDGLVAALNAEAGEGTWAAVPSPATVPTTGEDVIRTALIYRPATIKPVGTSTILDDPAFASARAPLAQTFTQVDRPASGTFSVIVNHFKSKGSGDGANADQGDGQGASNAARVQQATALVDFARAVEERAGTDAVFLTGDFNAYNREDPVRIIEEAGFVNVAAERTTKETYQFDGGVGSLDHVFASAAADATITGADIWNINAYESVAREYSRYNYNATDLYDASPFRASDHDPEIVGFDAAALGSSVTVEAPATVRAGEDVVVRATVASGTGPVPTGEVTLVEGGTELASGTLEDGTVTLRAADLGIGRHVLEVVYAGDSEHSGASRSVAVTVLKSTAGLTASAGPSTYGTGAVLDVTGAPGASGRVLVSLGDVQVGSGSLTNGTARIVLSRTIPVGTNQLRVFYAGSSAHDPDSTKVALEVRKAATTIKRISVSPATIVKGRTKPFVELSVTGAGFTVDGGTVTVRASGRNHTGTVRGGKVRIRLGAFTSSGPAKKVTATFAGNGVAKASSTSFTVRVLAR
ncbi:ExeM/NucH family extracellular endonuclease [Aeromicrobium sp. S22]|uniref:ExeM/NucH family extracellular endonuclease n=1 Tax=Aeromicrobium sp. S22 TaxID=2662029 RepID=UPI00129EB815|nr:ExeM/NucH family extracellular endonuclease [Aeromicrobium sp. S22]MRK02917.1 ExeM/NucH family extracellular endonuclease [Aeromicrobium sp. S22]